MIAQWILFALLIGVLATIAAEAIDRVLRALRLPARWVWVAALVFSTAWPAVAVLRANAAPAAADVAPASPLAVSIQTATTVVTRASEQTFRVSLDAMLLGAWALASLVFATRLVRGIRALGARRRRWRSASVDGIDVRVSDDIGPAVVGLRRMEVVLPDWALSLDATLRAMVLRHEEEHRRSGDPLLLALSALLIVLVPWNAAVWWQARRLRLAIELDCDARVLGADPDPERYGLLLLGIAERRSTVRGVRARLVAGLLEPAHHLERRIAAMTPGATSLSRGRAFALCALGVVAIIGACSVDTPPEPGTRAAAFSADTIAPMKRGLDLQGGMHLATDEAGAVLEDVRAVLGDTTLMVISKERMALITEQLAEYKLLVERLKAMADSTDARRGARSGSAPRIPLVEQGIVGAVRSDSVALVEQGVDEVRSAVDSMRAVRGQRQSFDRAGQSVTGRDTSVQAAYWEFQVTHPAQWIAGTGAPRYPEVLKAAGIEGTVVASFVVDATGVPDTSTFKALRSSSELFTIAVRDALPSMQFTPAVVTGGHKVKQVIQQEFRFEIKP